MTNLKTDLYMQAPQIDINLRALHKALSRKIKDLDVHVRLAPDAYEEIDDLVGVPRHPTFFEEAVVLHAMSMPPHAWDPVLDRWNKKPGKPCWRCFRINTGGVLSEVYPNGHIDNLLLIRDANTVDSFLRSVPKAIARKTGAQSSRKGKK